MDPSPLIKAHDHAKAASSATQTSDSTVAITEHTSAAGEFANAAQKTTSVEALRTLKLLEQHHRKMSELLRAPMKSSAADAASEQDSQPDEKEAPDPSASSAVAGSRSGPNSAVPNEKSPPPMPTLTKQPRHSSRDLGASIASNLASARGIRSKYRSQPLNPSVSNTEAPGNMEASSRRTGSRTKMQTMLENTDRPNTVSSPEKNQKLQEEPASINTVEGATSSNDEGFSRFYSAFGSIINRISAPLAFAGLPLINEEQAEEQVQATPAPDMPPQRRSRPRSSVSSSAEPDLSKFYSKAALRAVARDGQSTNDSFYVVPTSGHTASYASILSFADKEKRRMGASAQVEVGGPVEDMDEDDFVDARESQAPHSPTLRKRGGKSRADRELNNMVEELYLENKSLKDMLDKVSKRLHAFESMSQNSGMRLAESMRLMRPGSPVTGGKVNSVEETLLKEVRELKEQNMVLSKQNEDLEKNFTKARANLLRYREKWDQLKAGAKARRAGVQGSSEVTEEGLRSPSLA
ncbi:hypothetical protein F4780DRAFT_590963 [Xylariomycetidae sp. FL0641]|nr:hypothetical protein F4780DRAFT_590963 [Xylariomycetidae sp. FL0641]